MQELRDSSVIDPNTLCPRCVRELAEDHAVGQCTIVPFLKNRISPSAVPKAKLPPLMPISMLGTQEPDISFHVRRRDTAPEAFAGEVDVGLCDGLLKSLLLADASASTSASASVSASASLAPSRVGPASSSTLPAWCCLDGSVHEPLWVVLRLAVVGLVSANPGLSRTTLKQEFASVLSEVQMDELVKMLLKDRVLVEESMSWSSSSSTSALALGMHFRRVLTKAAKQLLPAFEKVPTPSLTRAVEI
jgi:hypothetical protein